MLGHSSVNRSGKNASPPLRGTSSSRWLGRFCWFRWFRDNRGASATEYGLLLVAILLVVASAYKVLGKNVRQAADKSTGAMQ